MTDPLLPDCASPVFKVIDPLVPLEPEGNVKIENAPLVEAALCPLSTETDPPVNASFPPPSSTIRPPAFSRPLPTTVLILPAVPDVAFSLEIVKLPLLPLDAIPDFNLRAPLVPTVALLICVESVNEPLDVVSPRPDSKEMDPPVPVSLVPE